MQHVVDDGGRAASGYSGNAGDCVCRAIVIAGLFDYQTVYQRLAEGMATQRTSKHCRKKARSARNGISTERKWFKDLMAELGFTWFPCCQIGLGAAPISTLPQEGRLVVVFRRHYAAMINGTIHDTWDPTYGYDRKVYGYWKLD